MRILSSEVGHTDLVSDLGSEFIGRPVHATLQVSGYSSYDLCHPGVIADQTVRHTDRQYTDHLPAYMISSAR